MNVRIRGYGINWQIILILEMKINALIHNSQEKPGPDPLNDKKLREVRQIIDEMLHDSITEPSESPWASPIVLVKKKTGKMRFCIDYWKVNNVTRDYFFPLPLISSIIQKVVSGKIC